MNTFVNIGHTNIGHSNKFDQNRSALVEVIHTAGTGRVRYNVKGLQGVAALERYLTEKLSEEAGINLVSVHSTTGHVLVLFSPRLTVRAIASLIDRSVRAYVRERTQHKTARTSPQQNIRAIATPQPGKLASPTEHLTSQDMDHDTKAWHLLEAHQITAELQTSPESGLSSELAEHYLNRYGANILPEAAPRSKIELFLEQFKSIPVALLSVAAVVSVLTGGLADAMVILGVVLINGVIGYTTESQSDRIIRSLKHLVKPSAMVMRNRHQQEISVEAIVQGDLLILRPGTYVPADARVIQANRLSVDESALTGESIPVTKTTEPLKDTEVPLADRVNMVYMGTLVTGGQGLAVVVATAHLTEMGRIQSLMGEAQLPQTPMERQLDQVGEQLVAISGVVCAIVFGIGLLRGYGFLEMLKTSISLAVAAVPEGLPTIATTTLALGIQDMRQQKVLIRRLDAVEALGSVQSLCLDKTGTLTENTMSVVEVQTDSQPLLIENGRFTNSAIEMQRDGAEGLRRLMQVIVLCNECEVNGDGATCTIQGSATEKALMTLAIAAHIDILQLRQQHPLVKTQHRSEERNFMLTLHQDIDEKKLIAVKGNPLEVLEICHWQRVNDRIVPLTQSQRQNIEIENDRMAGKALRVLGIAYGHTDDPDHPLQDNLVWLGLVGMADPIRKGAKELIRVFHRAGINTLMITGDQSPTAYAIGKALNLSQGEPLEILDSTHLAQLDPEVIKTLCDRVHVFARISPAHKLQIVQALQQAGKVVAMTGDGINDAPALKAAEVGIAMGSTGTDVAREVADVVLEDDNLETMAIAISQGRTIYSNIRKSVHFLLSTNLSEIMVMLAGTSFGIGQPLNALQLLWLNLVTDIFPGLALALEPAEPDVLLHPPRNPNESIIQPSDFQRILFESATLSASALGAYGYGIWRYGISAQSSTIGFMSLTLAQLMHALSCRSMTRGLFSPDPLPPNGYLTIALGGSVSLQILSAVVPGLSGLLKTTPIHLLDGMVIAGSAFLPLLVNEGTKGFGKRPGDLET
ncbi:MAG: cation-transporting P-type ATPase [Oculatellaceae cyanobacterium Prado106]|jgi:Ca2+-transporting ATPase|nr:cation-transporting P-type ATPase [Oculatellaceae cyanobacterium Prado106]